MRNTKHIALIMPAFNEAPAIAGVLANLPEWLDHVVVVDNRSTDETAMIALAHGATVIEESLQGYGAACLAGIAAVPEGTDIVVFLDADGSDDTGQMAALVDPIIGNDADFVLGQRHAPGAQATLTPQQRYGNRFACALIKFLYGAAFTDLGPFRAIRYTTIQGLQLREQTYGWTVEMQIKAVQNGLRWCEVSVPYRKRLGRSKISGTLRGILGAGYGIISTIIKLKFFQPSLNP